MTGARPAAALSGGVALLERALCYADSAISLVGKVRGHASRLLGALAEASEGLVWVGGLPVPESIVTSAAVS